MKYTNDQLIELADSMNPVYPKGFRQYANERDKYLKHLGVDIEKARLPEFEDAYFQLCSESLYTDMWNMIMELAGELKEEREEKVYKRKTHISELESIINEMKRDQETNR
jgi:hypothetical protein